MQPTPCASCSTPPELAALQEYLLARPTVVTAPPPALAARLKDPADLVATILSGLATGEPTAVWPLLQTEAARAHARWPELCVRVIEAAVQRRSVGVDLSEWHGAVASHVHSSARVAPLAFRKLTVDSQLQLLEDVKLTESEEASVRAEFAGGDADSSEERDAAVAAALGAKRRRDAAARLLQARLPAYVARLRERRQRDSALRRARAWLARSCTLRARAVQSEAALALLAQAVTLAARAAAWRVMLGALSQLWDAMRVHLHDPAALPPPGRAQWHQRPQDQGEAPLWQLTPAPSSASRTVRGVLQTVLHFTELLRSGEAHLSAAGAGVPLDAPLADLAVGAAWRGGAAPCASLPESGAQAQRWLTGCRGVDFAWLNQVFLAGFSVFAAQDRLASVVEIGGAWSKVTCGAFDGVVMPHVIASAQRLGADAAPFVAALAGAQQTRSEAANALEAARASAQRMLADVPALAAAPSDRGRRGPANTESESASARSAAFRSSNAKLGAEFCEVQVRCALGR